METSRGDFGGSRRDLRCSRSLGHRSSTQDEKKLGIALATIAVTLPHGRRDEMIGRLLSLAPRRSRASLLRNLVLSGEIIDTELVKSGIAEVFEAAKKQSWILWEGYELRDWLQLLPFTSHPAETFDAFACNGPPRQF